jgi:hypothetical protein
LLRTRVYLERQPYSGPSIFPAMEFKCAGNIPSKLLDLDWIAAFFNIASKPHYLGLQSRLESLGIKVGV